GPAGFHFHPQVQHHTRLEYLLHVCAGGAADQLQTVALAADDDLLLALLVHQNQPMNVQHAVGVGEFLDLHGNLVGQLVTELSRDLFTDDFRRQKTRTAIGHLVFRKQERTFGKIFAHTLLHRIQIVVTKHGQRNDLGEVAAPGQTLNVRQQPVLGLYHVAFVDKEKNWRFYPGQGLQHHLVLLVEDQTFDHKQHDIHIVERTGGGTVHDAVDGLALIDRKSTRLNSSHV